MGRESLAALQREPDMEPVGAVCGRERGDSIQLPEGSGIIPLSTDLKGMVSVTGPDVVLDFTNAEAAMDAAHVTAARGIDLVTGSSGLSEADLEALDRLSKEHGVGIVVAPNFALGAVLLTHLATEAARHFDYVEIVESHHETKIDAPSGTALALARALAQVGNFQWNRPEKESLPGTRGAEHGGVGIHSVRMPGRSAHHEVIFGAAGQTLTLRHDTMGRDCYMPGVVRAVREVVKRKGLVVGLSNILGL